jgi:hypothetical protein
MDFKRTALGALRLTDQEDLSRSEEEKLTEDHYGWSVNNEELGSVMGTWHLACCGR